VTVRNLVKRYGDVVAVDDASWEAPRGQVTTVLGPNGAGKTTTLEICEGFRRADAGQVSVLGYHPVVDAVALHARVGVMLQDGGVYGSSTPRQALAHAAALYASPADVTGWLQRLGLGEAANTAYRRLSGGQQRRTCLALALIGRPELVFLDEPSSGLDPQAKLAVLEVVRELRDAGVTVVLTTHDMGEAQALAQHVVIVDHGRVVAAGTASELVAGESGHDTVVEIELADADLPLDPLRAFLGPDFTITPAGRGQLSVTGPAEAATVSAVTDWAAQHEVVVSRIGMRPRTLNDVFLDLTGRQLRS